MGLEVTSGECIQRRCTFWDTNDTVSDMLVAIRNRHGSQEFETTGLKWQYVIILCASICQESRLMAISAIHIMSAPDQERSDYGRRCAWCMGFARSLREGSYGCRGSEPFRFGYLFMFTIPVFFDRQRTQKKMAKYISHARA